MDDSPRVRRHNLPVPRTSFVGREREVSELVRTLAVARLVTLTGAGGSGKTRLALEAARELMRSGPSHCHFSPNCLEEGAFFERLGIQNQEGRSVLVPDFFNSL